MTIYCDECSDAAEVFVCARCSEKLRADLARVTAERDAAVRTAERIDNKWHDAIEQRDAARARVRELLEVARAAVAFAMTASGTDFIGERIKLRALVDALPPSMLEEPSDG